jgi:hypothetical protein
MAGHSMLVTLVPKLILFFVAEVNTNVQQHSVSR